MISSLWHSVIYQPLFNLLILLIGVLPGQSVGLAIILLTVIVKLVLYPLTGKSIEAQHAMKELEPELHTLREKHGENKQVLAQKTMELYQERGVNPFSGCLPILVQIPIIFGLYWVFFKGLPVVDAGVLYGFVAHPGELYMHFLSFDLMEKSLVLALLTGVTQFIQARISMKRQPALPKSDGKKPSFQEDFAKSMQIQMVYVLPVMIGAITYNLPAAVALYWTTSNILGIGQEFLMTRKLSQLSKK